MGPTDADDAAEADYDSHRAAYEQGKRDGRAEALREVIARINERHRPETNCGRYACGYCGARRDVRDMLAGAEARQLQQQEDFDRGAEHGRIRALRGAIARLERLPGSAKAVSRLRAMLADAERGGE